MVNGKASVVSRPWMLEIGQSTQGRARWQPLHGLL